MLSHLCEQAVASTREALCALQVKVQTLSLLSHFPWFAPLPLTCNIRGVSGPSTLCVQVFYGIKLLCSSCPFTSLKPDCPSFSSVPNWLAYCSVNVEWVFRKETMVLRLVVSYICVICSARQLAWPLPKSQYQEEKSECGQEESLQLT